MDEARNSKHPVTLDGNSGLERIFLNLETGLFFLVLLLGSFYLQNLQSPNAPSLLKACASIAVMAGISTLLRKAFYEYLEFNPTTQKIDLIRIWFGKHYSRTNYCTIQDVEALVFTQTPSSSSRYGPEEGPYLWYELYLKTRDNRLISASPMVRLNKLHTIYEPATVLAHEYGWELVHPQNEIGKPMLSLEDIFENQKFKAEQTKLMIEQSKVLGNFFMPILILCVLISAIGIAVTK